MKAYTYIVAVLVVVALISYTSGYTALNAYKSWVDYSNPYAGALEHVRYEDVGAFQPLADNLVFILLDGATVDVLLDLRKYNSDVDKLLSMGALYANGLSITPSYSVPTIITYGLTVRFPFPDWGNAVLYFASLMRVAFTGFTVLPIALATSIILTVIGAYLFRRLKMG